MIDSVISHSHHVEMERQLAPWMPDEDDPDCPELDNIFDGTLDSIQLSEFLVLLSLAVGYTSDLWPMSCQNNLVVIELNLDEKDEEMDLHFLADKDLGLSSVDHNTELMSNSISWSSPSLDVDIRFVLLLGWIRTRLKIKVARSVWLFRSLEHRMEFKLNPNAKSFTPLSSMRLHTAVSDGSIYYPSNATAVPHMHGLPIGVGVGPSFGHQPVLYNPQAPPMQSSQAYVHPSGPMSFSSSFAVWTADDCWAASTILLCAELSTCK
ncbi:hypothetical protein BHM03_00016116 [Ensete ventricosum]|nr:hypothetical protein BHM03_00016116 [Ensete ventricosum]